MSTWFIAEKDPEAILDYTIDWGPAGEDWLQGDTINAASWIVQNGITLGNGANGAPAPTFTTTTTTAWLIGGSPWADYVAKVLITTLAGRKDERSILVKVRER